MIYEDEHKNCIEKLRMKFAFLSFLYVSEDFEVLIFLFYAYPYLENPLKVSKKKREIRKKKHRLGKFYYNAQKTLTFLLVWSLFIRNFAIKKKSVLYRFLKMKESKMRL